MAEGWGGRTKGKETFSEPFSRAFAKTHRGGGWVGPLIERDGFGNILEKKGGESCYPQQRKKNAPEKKGTTKKRPPERNVKGAIS